MRNFRQSVLFVFFVSFFYGGALCAGYSFDFYEPKCKIDRDTRANKPPVKSKKKESVADKRVIINKVMGVVVSWDNEFPPEHVIKTTCGVEFYRLSDCVRHKNKEYLKNLIERKVIGKVLTFESLNEIKEDIRSFYRGFGQELVIVTVPEQDVTDGVIVIEILEAKVGNVCIQGNEWFTTERLCEYVSLQEGDILNNAQVERDIAFINQNPFRNCNVMFSPGKCAGTTDLTYNIRDVRPVKVYAGVDNTGFKVTDLIRIFAGFTWGDFLFLDQVLSFQYIASPDFTKFQGYMLHYSIPLLNSNLLEFFGGLSFIQIENSLGPSNLQKGRSAQASGRYVIPLVPMRNWIQDLKLGIDYKHTNNDLVVGDTVISNVFASIFQYMASWETNFVDERNACDFLIEGFAQPFAYGESMSESTYAKLRPDAVTRFAYVKGVMKYNYRLNYQDINLNLKTTFQLATGKLLPLEELGFGGFYSIRGYPERVVNVDNGIIFNFEVRSPKLGPTGCNNGPLIHQFTAIGFLDMGFGGDAGPSSVDSDVIALAGIGPGVRYDFASWVHARLDLGFRLTPAPVGAESTSLMRVYFSVAGSF